jgi:hypothetical protein
MAYDFEADNARLLAALTRLEKQQHDFLRRMSRISAEMIRRQAVVTKDERAASGQPAA